MNFRKLQLLFFLLLPSLFYAQNFIPNIQTYIERNASELGINITDTEELRIDSYHYSKSTNTHNVYVIQQYKNLDVFNAVGMFAIRNNEVVYAKPTFQQDLRKRAKNNTASLSPLDAIAVAASQLGLGAVSDLRVTHQENNHTFTFSKGSISHDPIPVKLVWQTPNFTEDFDLMGELKLAWDLSIHALDGQHWWSVRIDAETGDLISKHNWMLSCTFEGHNHSGIVNHEAPSTFHLGGIKKSAYVYTHSILTEDDENETPANSYRVYPMPVESPNHGDRQLVTNPANEDASPFGWHDTDGEDGAEFTITRGNNVWAKEDRAGNNGVGYAPDGGEDLIFDYPLAFDAPPAVYEDAAITNLFYWNNKIHDVWYQYGFDEASGNFQQTNYSDEGAGGDFVFADAQDGSGINNANFGTPPDGNNPRMQMFLWNTAGQANPPLFINEPALLEGEYAAILAGFGAIITTEPITADLVLVEDDVAGVPPYEACGVITNEDDIDGKIAVVLRGNCPFVDKVFAAQEAGAIAVIVVNNVASEPITMGGSNSNITIPSLMISLANGNLIIEALEDGVTVNMSIVNNGPFLIDGDYDNGIIAHEYGHGISTRLTGGRFQTNCLFNAEQMGEGWSDYIGLVMTMTEDDVDTQGRGYGTFAVNQPTNGNGIRPTPYSTDTSISPFTYNVTNNPNLTVPHGIGYVWATMLWDLTWALIDVYGFDPDLYNGTGGNNIAMQLVTDGLKLQNCSPGFVDGRDAILAADELANDGENSCLIWEVFAARGLGWDADQGSAFERNDQVEAFNMPPTFALDCTTFSSLDFNKNQLKIWPNPAKNRVNIQLDVLSAQDATIELFDINGRRLMQQKMNTSTAHSLDVSAYQKGIYLLKITTSEGSFTEKLMVQ